MVARKRKKTGWSERRNEHRTNRTKLNRNKKQLYTQYNKRYVWIGEAPGATSFSDGAHMPLVPVVLRWERAKIAEKPVIVVVVVDGLLHFSIHLVCALGALICTCFFSVASFSSSICNNTVASDTENRECRKKREKRRRRTHFGEAGSDLSETKPRASPFSSVFFYQASVSTHKKCHSFNDLPEKKKRSSVSNSRFFPIFFSAFCPCSLWIYDHVYLPQITSCVFACVVCTASTSELSIDEQESIFTKVHDFSIVPKWIVYGA